MYNSKHDICLLNCLSTFFSEHSVHVVGYSTCYNEAEQASIPGKQL